MTLNPRTKLLLDLAPLAAFFAGYGYAGIFTATAGLLAVTCITLAVIYAAERKIAVAPLLTGVIVLIFGGLALWQHDETFIKIKPTIVNAAFAAILLGGCCFKKGLLGNVLGTAFNLTERGWYVLSRRWGLFFLSLALLNEWVWRNFSTSVWVSFKVFGLIGLTLLFALAQWRFLQRHWRE